MGYINKETDKNLLIILVYVETRKVMRTGDKYFLYEPTNLLILKIIKLLSKSAEMLLHCYIFVKTRVKTDVSLIFNALLI